MVRITKIEIKSFKAFYGTYQINLAQDGEKSPDLWGKR